MGGTLGGPISRNKLFFFGGWERNDERNARFDQVSVPTAKMRNGDFSEVLANFPNFRIYDPATGDPATGAGRTFFENAIIPANRISSISRDVQALYPAPNTAGTNFGLQNNAFIARSPKAIRDNYDAKINWNRTSAHQIWGKASMMDASVQDLFYLGLDNAGGGDTTVTLFTRGLDVDAEPHAPSGRQRRVEQDGPSVGRAGLRHQLRPRFRHSRAEQRGGYGPRLDGSRALQRPAGVQHRPVGDWATTPAGRRCGARR